MQPPGGQPQIVPPGNYVCIACIGDQPGVQRNVSEENLTGQVDVYGDGFMGLRYGFNNGEHDDLHTYVVPFSMFKSCQRY